MHPIRIVPVRPVNLDIVKLLIEPIASTFSASVEIDEHSVIASDPAFNSSRLQFNSSHILQQLLQQYQTNDAKILGVTSVDLFIPILTFVFGEAQLRGSASIISTFRLNESFYGLEENSELQRERMIKEAVHELGHTYGLVHCRHFECVMHSSTSIEEIDLKDSQFCLECRRQLENII